jgi:hypothetical protein
MQDLNVGAMRATGAFAIAFVTASIVALILAVTISLEAKNMTTS